MSASPQRPEESDSTRLGLLYGLLAYGAWGFSPLYYKLLEHITPEAMRNDRIFAIEVLAHRICWSVVLLVIWLSATRSLAAARVWKRPRLWAALAVSTLLIGFNWGTFVYAIAIKQVASASLGYFINPLVSMLLGYVFLGERLRRPQAIAVALAVAGVAWLTWSRGSLPAIALILAFSFGFYGLLRKLIPVDARVGLLVEAVHLLPFALGAAVWLVRSETGVFARASLSFDLTLACSGFVTVLPLLWFTLAARRLKLATIGFMQYLAPSGQLLLAVFVFREPFNSADLVSFLLIWLGLGLYTYDLLQFRRRQRRTSPPVRLD